MRTNQMAAALRDGKVILGLNNMYPASGIINSMCHGWDFVWIDAQHGQHDRHTVLNALQAAMAMGVETLLRVPGHEYGIVGPFADLAPSAIMVPMVDTAQQARGLVEALRFPPLGSRSYGGRRVIDLYGREYYREQEMLLVAQIESLEAVDQAEAIISTPGVDGLFFGPDDMKMRMNIPINTALTDDARLRDAMERTARAARKAGKFCGIVASTPAALRMVTEMGYQLVAGGGDSGFIRAAAADLLRQLAAARDEKPAPAQGPSAPSVY